MKNIKKLLLAYFSSIYIALFILIHVPRTETVRNGKHVKKESALEHQTLANNSPVDEEQQGIAMLDECFGYIEPKPCDPSYLLNDTIFWSTQVALEKIKEQSTSNQTTTIVEGKQKQISGLTVSIALIPYRDDIDPFKKHVDELLIEWVKEDTPGDGPVAILLLVVERRTNDRSFRPSSQHRYRSQFYAVVSNESLVSENSIVKIYEKSKSSFEKGNYEEALTSIVAGIENETSKKNESIL